MLINLWFRRCDKGVQEALNADIKIAVQNITLQQKETIVIDQDESRQSRR